MFHNKTQWGEKKSLTTFKWSKSLLFCLSFTLSFRFLNPKAALAHVFLN